MDWSHFGLKRRPFRAAIDTSAYFPATAHEAACSTIAGAFKRRDPFALIFGNSGIGKSLVARRWLENLPPEVPKIYLPNIHATRPADLLQAILFDAHRDYLGLSEQELRLAVTDHILSASKGSYPTVLVIDEAQHLSHSAIEELRLLGNLEQSQGNAIFTLLVSQPTLAEAFQRPAYEAFAQRVAVRCRIESLNTDEASNYIRHQLKISGASRDLFTHEAIEAIARSSSGVPRIINHAATLAAEMAVQTESEQIDLEMVMEAISSLGIEVIDAEESETPLVLHPIENPKKHSKAGSKQDKSETVAQRPSKPKATRKRTA